MIQITEQQFTDTIRSRKNVVIKCEMVGQARLTSYKVKNLTIGLIRDYKAERTFFKI